MIDKDRSKPDAPCSRRQASNDNSGEPARRIDPRILTIARVLGRQIAREQLKKLPAANDNNPVKKR